MNAFLAPETTMTPEEAEAIVRRHLERVPESPTGPSVADVAEALRLPPEQVARLLAEVRATPQAVKPKRRTTKRERRVWLLSGVLALLVAGGGLMTAKAFEWGPFHRYDGARAVPFQDEYDVVVDGVQIGRILFDSGEPPSELNLRILNALERNETMSRSTQPSRSAEDNERSLNFARSGNWGQVDDAHLANFEIRRPDSMGHKMRWARTQVPVYSGDDALIADLVQKDRARRVADAIQEARSGGVVPAQAAEVSTP